jgi:muconolactone delta-isomerase
MEYLVTMTTHVPDGVPESDVARMRAREAAHTAELAAEGRVLRLWRPPLEAGEWRTLGLFAAAGAADLESVLASMPLRVWRQDEVTLLAPHPNDPGRGRVAVARDDREFLTTLVVTVAPGASDATVDEIVSREAQRTAELAAEGHLLRLWKLPGAGRNLGHWQALDSDHLQHILDGLPMADWLTVETVPLTRHPNDPALMTTSR